MKKVLITGGTVLFGKEIIKGFLKNNYIVYFTSTSKLKINNFLKEINYKNKNKLFPIQISFNDINDIKNFINKYNKIGFNILINNARELSNLKFNNKNYEEIKNFDKEFFLAIHLPYLLSTKLNKKFLESVVNITSMYGIVAPNKHLYKDKYKNSPIFYGVSKAAQIHLTKELSVRLIEHNIRVNCVSFGGVVGRTDKKFIERYKKMSPSKRMLQKDEIFGPIWFLSNKNLSTSAIGHNLVIDGGWTIW